MKTFNFIFGIFASVIVTMLAVVNNISAVVAMCFFIALYAYLVIAVSKEVNSVKKA